LIKNKYKTYNKKYILSIVWTHGETQLDLFEKQSDFDCIIFIGVIIQLNFKY